MAEQNSKERKVLYGEENNGDSIAGTGAFLGIALILGAIALAARTVMLINDDDISPAWIVLRIFGIVIIVALAIRLSKAMSALGQLVEENARLKTAVQYLFETHNIEVRAYDEVPREEILGAVDDGFEAMRIEADGVHFRKAGPRVKCPFCDREQPAGCEACENCGQRFFFEE